MGESGVTALCPVLFHNSKGVTHSFRSGPDTYGHESRMFGLVGGGLQLIIYLFYT